MELMGRISTMFRTLRASTPVDCFLRSRQDRGDCLFVVLKLPQERIASGTIVCCHAHTVIWISAGFDLVDQIPHGKGVFVDHDEVEKVRWIVTEPGRRFAVLCRAAHEGLEDGEKQTAVLGHSAFLLDLIGGNADHCVVRKCRKRIERPIGQIPATLKQLPLQLKGNEGFACPGGQREQQTIFACGDGFQNANQILL